MSILALSNILYDGQSKVEEVSHPQPYRRAAHGDAISADRVLA